MMYLLKRGGLVATIVWIMTVGCLKKELPVPRHESGDVTVSSVDMDASYKYQIFFNLRTNSVVGKVLKTEWDMGFETSADGYHVVLNGAKSMFSMRTTKSDFSDVSFTDTVGFSSNKKCDSHTGSYDSTAIGDWRNGNSIYIVDKGFDEQGVHLGYAKMQILSVTNANYSVRFATLSGADDATVTVTKDSAYNLSFLSLSGKRQLQVEPPRADWDLVFTQYTYVFYDQNPPVPYLVTGCLLNRYKTQAYLDSTAVFTDINFGTVANEKLTSDIGVIGYSWKTFNGTKYSIQPRYNYIIQSSEGVLYKLHFVSFYSPSGIKGVPGWEYQRL